MKEVEEKLAKNISRSDYKYGRDDRKSGITFIPVSYKSSYMKLAFFKTFVVLNYKIPSTSLVYAYYMFRSTLVNFRCIKLLMKLLCFRRYLNFLEYALVYVSICL